MKRITIFAIAALALAGCFKKVGNDTTFIIKPNLQTVSGGEFTAAEGVWGYACYLGGKWEPASYEDAAAMKITNTESGQTEEKPAAMSKPCDGENNAGRIKISTTSPHVLLVAVYEAGKMYAFRHYDVGENIPQTYLTLQFRTWKNDKYVDSGWTVNRAPAAPEPASGEEKENSGDVSENGNNGNSGSKNGSGDE